MEIYTRENERRERSVEKGSLMPIVV